MIAVTDTISRFFVWWFGELAACVPRRVRELFRRRPAMLSLTLSNEDVAFTLHRRGSSRHLGRIRLGAGLEPRRAVAPLLRGISLSDLDVVMGVPADRVLRRHVVLPLAAQENLREVLSFEMDRHTPFKASEVAFDYRVARVDRESKRIEVALAVVARELIDQAGRIAESFGLTLDRIGVADEAPFTRGGINLLPHDYANGRSTSQYRLLVALAASAAILALVAGQLPLHFKQRTLAAYEAQLAESRAAALEAEELKKGLAARVEHGRFLIDRRLSTPSATVLLAELTERLPDDTWLIQLRWQGDKLAIAGFSPAAAALIAGLEQSSLLSEVRFGSPVTADPRVGFERFNISAEVASAPGG
jgi:general secretion pathway protein L